MQVPKVVNVNYQHTDNYKEAQQWLAELYDYDVIACDFEAAVKYSQADIDSLTLVANKENIDTLAYIESKLAAGVLKATALDHPSHVVITHLSIAWSDSDSYVFILHNDEMRNLILEFLTTTEIKQVWHNAGFDFRLIYHTTGLMPKNYEDTEIYAKCVFNHVETDKARTGLKTLAGAIYGDWAVAEESFHITNMYNEDFIKYAAIDSCATLFVFNRLTEAYETGDENYPSTMDEYTPWTQLPAPTPINAEYSEPHFYHYTAKWLVRDTVRLMMNGLPIDLIKVQALEDRLDTILADVNTDIHNNPSVEAYLKLAGEADRETYTKAQINSKKTYKDFIVPFNSRNAVHRSAYMEVFSDKVGLKSKPKDCLPNGLPKWTATTIKTLSSTYPALKSLLTHGIDENSPTAIAAAEYVANLKAVAHNDKIDEKIATYKGLVTEFNPNSSKQVKGYFASLDIESEATSAKTGEPSWDRAQVERVNKTVLDEDVISLTQNLIDHSFAAIVRNNFVNAFYRFSVDDKLYGGYRLLGAKSGRYTSSKPNMLNMPSSRSIYAQPIKECFVAPEGFIVAAIDYAALEDRVVANLSGDENKLSIFTSGVDGHSLASVFYFPDEVNKLISGCANNTEAAIAFKALVDAKCTIADSIRNRSKPVSFGLA